MTNEKIIVPISESDAQDLMSGDEFNWTFETDKGQLIDVWLKPETE